MVQVFLDAIAFTTPILRQKDVGHDFLCVLAEPHKNMLWAGASFTVQVKSANEPIEYETDYALEWIRSQESPFFIAVGNKKSLRVDLYSTWRRMCASLGHHARRIEFRLASPPAGGDYVVTAEDYSTQTVYLGEPIISFSLHDIMERLTADRVRDVLRCWIKIDRENISQAAAGIHWIEGPRQHVRNEPPTGEAEGKLFWNPKNLRDCLRNFGRTSTVLRLTLQTALAAGATPENPARVAMLESLLGSISGLLADGADEDDK